MPGGRSGVQRLWGVGRRVGSERRVSEALEANGMVRCSGAELQGGSPQKALHPAWRPALPGCRFPRKAALAGRRAGRGQGRARLGPPYTATPGAWGVPGARALQEPGLGAWSRGGDGQPPSGWSSDLRHPPGHPPAETGGIGEKGVARTPRARVGGRDRKRGWPRGWEPRARTGLVELPDSGFWGRMVENNSESESGRTKHQRMRKAPYFPLLPLSVFPWALQTRSQQSGPQRAPRAVCGDEAAPSLLPPRRTSLPGSATQPSPQPGDWPGVDLCLRLRPRAADRRPGRLWHSGLGQGRCIPTWGGGNQGRSSRLAGVAGRSGPALEERSLRSWPASRVRDFPSRDQQSDPWRPGLAARVGYSPAT